MGGIEPPSTTVSSKASFTGMPHRFSPDAEGYRDQLTSDPETTLRFLGPAGLLIERVSTDIRTFCFEVADDPITHAARGSEMLSLSLAAIRHLDC